MSWLNLISPTIYSIFWNTNSEIGVRNYEVQISQDTVNWTVLSTVIPTLNPDSNNYSLPLSFVLNSWVRINANMLQGNYYTKPIFVVVDSAANNPSIINPVYFRGAYTDILSWNTLNEKNAVNYYLIEKSKDSINFNSTKQITAKGDSKYTLYVSYGYGTKKPMYRVTTVLKNGNKLPPINFK